MLQQMQASKVVKGWMIYSETHKMTNTVLLSRVDVCRLQNACWYFYQELFYILSPYSASSYAPDEETEKIIRILDKDKDGKLSLTEFLEIQSKIGTVMKPAV